MHFEERSARYVTNEFRNKHARNYTIRVYAEPVAGETNNADNNFTDSIIYVGIPSDINADGIVEMMDFFIMSQHYLGRTWHLSFIQLM
jgi:hypothetical protein